MSHTRDLARRVLYALSNIDQFFASKGKERNINYAELSLLYALDATEAISQKELSEQIYFPLTTINTIVKAWEKQGLLVQTPVEGKRREKHIVLTDEGKRYARTHLDFIYRAEEAAMKKTVEKYSSEFVDALEYYGACVRECYDEEQEQTK